MVLWYGISREPRALPVGLHLKKGEWKMQDSVRLFVKLCAEIIKPKGPIYEFGSLQVPGRGGDADLRRYFHGSDYTGCDMAPGMGVDRIEDLEKGVSIGDNTVSVVLCMETLEHVFDVFKAVTEMKRVLKNDEGIYIMSSVFHFGIHSYPADYWRFTPQCFLRLLADFDVSLVIAQDDPLLPTSILGIGIKTKNKDEWKDTFSLIAKKFEIELKNNFRYDRSAWRKLKLALYKNIWIKKYHAKNNRTRITWSFGENSH